MPQKQNMLRILLPASWSEAAAVLAVAAVRFGVVPAAAFYCVTALRNAGLFPTDPVAMLVVLMMVCSFCSLCVVELRHKGGL